MKRENLNDAIMNAINDNDYVGIEIKYGDTDGGGGEVAFDLFFAIDVAGGGGPITYYDCDEALPDVIIEALCNDCDVSIDHIDVAGDCVGKIVFVVDRGGGGGPITYYDFNGQLLERPFSFD